MSKDSNSERFFIRHYLDERFFISNPVIIKIRKVLPKLCKYISRFFDRFVAHEIIFKIIFLNVLKSPVKSLLFIISSYFFSQAEDWQPLLVYRNSLVHGEGEVPVVPSKRPYARKRKAYGSDDDDDDDDADYV